MSFTTISNDSALLSYEAGNLPTEFIASNALFPKVDFDKILSKPSPGKKIQELSPQALYFNLKQRGVEDCLEVLPLISKEQFIRICDYDVWHEDRLVPAKLFQWLGHYYKIAPKQAFYRFKALDEEYQLAAFAPYIRVYTPEEYENMTETQQDQTQVFPGNALYYTIDTSDQELYDQIQNFIDAAMAEDMNYLMLLLTHATYMPPNEQEALIAQFRKARLEEDGFADYEESLKVFAPYSTAEIFKKYQKDWIENPELKRFLPDTFAENRLPFLNRVFAYADKNFLWSSDEKQQQMQSSFMLLANSLCSACHVETDDLNSLKRILQQAQGMIGFALEYLCRGDLNLAFAILNQEYPSNLFRIAIGLVDKLRFEFLLALKQLGVKEAENITAFYRSQKYGRTLDLCDRELLPLLGLQKTETVKGLFNRFPSFATVGSTEQKEIYFRPVGSVHDFMTLAQSLDQIINSIAIAHICNEAVCSQTGKASLEETHHALEQYREKRYEHILLNGLVQVYLGGVFCNKIPSQEELERLQKMDGATLRVKGSQLQNAIKLKTGGKQHWSRQVLEKILADVPEMAGDHWDIIVEIADLEEYLLEVKDLGIEALKNLFSTQELG